MVPVLETGATVSEARLAAVMIHGRGRTPEEMANLGEALAIDGVRYYCPEAPAGSWYPRRFLEPLEDNQPDLGRALSAIDALIERLGTTGFPVERVVLCGFSQGACLAAQTLMLRPAPYAAGLFFTGGLIGPPGTTWRSPERIPGVPVLLTGSENDDWVPAWRVRETAAVLSGFGATVDTVIYEDRAHVVSDDEIRRARHLLRSCLERPGPIDR
ncbi:alpha/beta hydrolase [Mesorhizobium sp. L-8-3]|uniref:alpha/beta hydrolase n=1 Tax=Mesorhizobium sp. L-8-3 TaxID=2744522 RepID=UPI0019271E25|nr:alpha/beta fold hydrolase [Mesorhizobium sp. L-8-3]BCH24455.1 phospholipase/carboxylesterase [Mesorhizobium sp. L-8-3]